MREIPAISESEAIVMQALWDQSPLSADRILEYTAAHADWSPSTVKTLLARLVRKKAIAAVADGRRFLYRPLIAREAYLTQASHGLLERLFDGRVAPLVSHFAQQKKLSARDIAELKRLLEELDHD